ncbi:Cytosolic non-specific dipeptidase [Chlamydiales bacterium STE3]|nr:Cytosolic non-specific dipeptidase [Chlamydiales bacterium STE3]
MSQSLQNIIQTSQNQTLKDYFTFLSFASVSSEPNFKQELLDCVNWLKAYIDAMGFETELWRHDEGHPVLYASYKVNENAPTLLIYNHYDVQPYDPLDLWETPPFQPTLRGKEVYARGAQDNKGQCFYVLQGLKALLQKEGTLPLNIKLCIEGEEENGSASLDALLQSKKEALKADYLAIVDLGIPSPNKPAITLGNRGIITMDIEVSGSSIDLHSGVHGGAVFNPIHGLVQMLAALRDENGKIAIPGFYDAVSEISDEERGFIDFAIDEKEYQHTFATQTSGGERHFPVGERLGLRPTVEINGITGGYCGEGFKTVIPALAKAKISCRLVPDQQPEKIAHLVADFLMRKTPGGLKTSINLHGGGGAATRTNPHSKAVQAFAKAYEEVFQKNCQFILSGASIPIAAKLSEAANAEMVLLGLGLSTDCIHAPNEHFGIDRLEKGALIIAKAIEFLSLTEKQTLNSTC